MSLQQIHSAVARLCGKERNFTDEGEMRFPREECLYPAPRFRSHLYCREQASGDFGAGSVLQLANGGHLINVDAEIGVNSK